MAHANQIVADIGPEQDGADVERARADTAPAYKEDASKDPPAYDLKEGGSSPGYDFQQSLEEWMRGGDIVDN